MIDTHCHIDDEQYRDDLEAVILRQQEAGVEAILVPGVNERNAADVLAVCSRFPGYLYPALGLHPEDVTADWQQQLEAIYPLVENNRLVAIGEIGLDYHFSTEYKAEQQSALREQLRWAAAKGLPVMIHARDAAEDTLRIIKEECRLANEQGKQLRGVLHCYSGSYEIAMEYIRMGWYLGIGGVITFKNCRLADTLCPPDGRPAIPLERLVLETDAPYMAPVPYRGKTNESRYMTYVAEKIAETYHVSKNEVILATNKAANTLFCIK